MIKPFDLHAPNETRIRFLKLETPRREVCMRTPCLVLFDYEPAKEKKEPELEEEELLGRQAAGEMIGQTKKG
jgi:hypothetical protein